MYDKGYPLRRLGRGGQRLKRLQVATVERPPHTLLRLQLPALQVLLYAASVILQQLAHRLHSRFAHGRVRPSRPKTRTKRQARHSHSLYLSIEKSLLAPCTDAGTQNSPVINKLVPGEYTGTRQSEKGG